MNCRIVITTLLLLAGLFASGQSLSESLKTSNDDPYYRESKQYQKAANFYSKGKFSKAANAYRKCLQDGVIHPVVKLELMECLDRSDRFHQTDKYFKGIEGMDSIRFSVYYLNYEAKRLIKRKEYNKVKTLITPAFKNPYFLGQLVDSQAMGILFAHLGYCKIYGQDANDQLIRAFDIGDTAGGCNLTFKLDYLDAICNYSRAIEYGCRDTNIKINLEYLEQLIVDHIKPEYELPIELPEDSFYTPGDPLTVNYKESRYHIPGRSEQIFEQMQELDEIVFVLDYSGSMDAKIKLPGSDTMKRVDLLRAEVIRTLRELKELNATENHDIKVGAISIEDCDIAPTILEPVDTNNFDKLMELAYETKLIGSTPLNNRLRMADDLFSGDSTTRKAVFLLSDGKNTCGGDFSSCAILSEYKNKNVKFIVYSLLLAKRKNLKDLGVYDCLSENSNGILVMLNKNYQLVVEVKEKDQIRFNTPAINPDHVSWNTKKRSYQLRED